MNICVFCKIIKGEMPKFLIYEDKMFMAFLDIFPRTKGHTLVIPKKHYSWTYDVPEFGKYWEVVLKITRAMQKALRPTFITYVTHGLDVSHAHIHVMPRYKETEFVPEIKQFPKTEFEKVARLLRASI